jgi:hypothetical protein
LRHDSHLSEEGTYLVVRIRGRKRTRRQRARIGAPDAALTPNGGLAAVSELCDRLGVIEALDTARHGLRLANMKAARSDLRFARTDGEWAREPKRSGCWKGLHSMGSAYIGYGALGVR